MIWMKKFVVALGILAAINGPAVASPLEITIVFPTGTTHDVTARAVQQYLQDRAGIQSVVVPRPGAGGKIGMQWAAAQPANGRQILIASSGQLVTERLFDSNYVDVNTWEFVGPLWQSNNYIVVNSSSNIRTLQDFVEQARRRPVNCANAIPQDRLVLSLMKQQLNLQGLELVQMKSLPEAAVQLLGGHIECTTDTLTGPVWRSPEHKDKWRVIATFSDEAVPGVPNVNQLIPGLSARPWFAVGVARATPEPQKSQLLALLREMYKDDKFRAVLAAGNTDLMTGKVSIPQPARSANALAEQQFEFWRSFMQRNPSGIIVPRN